MGMHISPHRKAKKLKPTADLWLPIGKNAPSTGSGHGRRGAKKVPTGAPGTPNGECLGNPSCRCGGHNKKGSNA